MELEPWREEGHRLLMRSLALDGQRHARYFLTFLSQQAEALEGTNQTTALAAIAGQIADVRAAWRWVVANGAIEQPEAARDALFTFYSVRRWFREGEAAFGHLAEMLHSRQDTAAQHHVNGTSIGS